MTGTRPERRRGRRPGGEDTRAQLLAAARIEFAERGYEGATVRRIAERADVDAAMVNHWFGGKEALFTASLDLPVSPAQMLAEVIAGDPEQLGGRIVRRFLTVWDVGGGGPLAALIHSVAGREDAARMLREFVKNVLVGPIVGAVAPDRHELRGSLMGSQLIGLGMVRYVLKLEPLASAEPDVVVAAIAPTVQRYLTGTVAGIPSTNAT
ncbi:MAG TPA: TetR family transcriptional regulator [Pseudonocardia sp.]